MIVKIKLKDETGNEFTMMFGDSYKKWYIQFQEYIINFKIYHCIDATVSQNKWIGWGGLKWCNELDFQEELNREGCQSSDPNNPNPRKYEKMCFYHSRFIKSKIIEIMHSQRVHNEWIEARNKEWKKEQLNNQK
jgi:hypothetical protein